MQENRHLENVSSERMIVKPAALQDCVVLRDYGEWTETSVIIAQLLEHGNSKDQGHEFDSQETRGLK